MTSSGGLDHDDVLVDEGVVRGFMLTRGRTRASVAELGIETVVHVTDSGRAKLPTLEIDHRRIVAVLSGPLSIAEISAHLSIPLRAAIVHVSEMVAAGTLQAGDAIGDADTDLLQTIRSALQLL